MADRILGGALPPPGPPLDPPLGMTLAKVKEQDGMTLAKVKEQDGMTVAKVRHAQVSHTPY